MHTQHSLDAILKTIRRMQTPLASLYVPLTPEALGRRPDAAASQARDALAEAAVPPEVTSKILRLVRQSGHARTTAIFANESETQTIEFQDALPIEDAASGRLVCSWGEAQIAPLILASGRPHFSILCLHRDRARLLESFLGEIQEVETWDRSLRPPEVDPHGVAKEIHPAYVPNRGGGARDDLQNHRDIEHSRFLGKVVDDIARRGAAKGTSLLVVGTDPEASRARQLLESRMSLPIATVSAMDNPRASIGAILEHCRPAMDEEIRRRNLSWLQSGESQKDAICGTACVRALARGRVDQLAVSWNIHPGAREAVLRLADKEGSELHFVDGPPGETLLETYEGMVALPRWPATSPMD